MRVNHELWTIRRRLLLGVILLALHLSEMPALAQPTVAPTRTEVGDQETRAGYNIRQSFELGYRYRSIGGNEGMYRSAVNFGNGVRLLSSSLAVDSVDGHGGYFDQIRLDTQGLGNDPYQFARLRIEKNVLYKYDLNWRSNAYFNPGVGIAAGQHAIDSVRNMQDHDLVLLPQSPFKLFLGFSRNTQSGAALTTFHPRGDEFPLFADIRRQQHEYRLGWEVALMGWKLNAMRGWVNFKEDTPVRLLAPSAGNNPDNLTTLDSFTRAEPYHGNSPYWRVMLFKESTRWAFDGRFTYVEGRRAFVQDQTQFGASRFGVPTGQQILTFGDARRPALAANGNFMLFPSDRVTITNQTTLNHIRMVGNASITQIDDGMARDPFFPFTFLGLRTIANATDVDFRMATWIAIRAGYQYSTRRIRSIEGSDPLNNPTPEAERQPIEQTNTLHTGLFGVRLKPARPLTIRLDAEIGRADRPIYPISRRNFHALRGRIEYKTDQFRIAGFARADYNVNSASLASFASRNRQYGVDATWTPGRGALRNFFIDVGYSKLHVDTLGTLAYFAVIDGQNTDIVNDRSYYVSNIHTGTMATRFTVGSRVEVSLGLSHVQDTGDGRGSALIANDPYTAQPALTAAQTFPLRFTSPLGRVSVSIQENVRWNLGYQHYGYDEKFGPLPGQILPNVQVQASQDFRAHTGYTSVLWSF